LHRTSTHIIEIETENENQSEKEIEAATATVVVVEIEIADEIDAMSVIRISNVLVSPVASAIAIGTETEIES
jgi:hypothetical protein